MNGSTENFCCPNCDYKLSVFKVWVTGIELNCIKCPECRAVLEFVGVAVPLWLNILSLIVFVFLGFLAIELTGSYWGVFAVALIYLPVGYIMLSHNANTKKLRKKQ